MFTHRHMEEIAATVRLMAPWKAHHRMSALRFADMLEKSNPNFNRARFYTACDYVES
jgi:hypothetical protein